MITSKGSVGFIEAHQPAPQRPRSIQVVVRLADSKVKTLVRHAHGHIPLCKPLSQLIGHIPGDSPKVLLAEWLKHHQLIQAIEKLWPEMLLAAFQHLLARQL